MKKTFLTAIFGLLVLGTIAVGWKMGTGLRSHRAEQASDTLRVDHYDVDSLLSANDLVVEGTVIRQSDATVEADAVSHLQRTDRVLKVMVAKVLRGDGISPGEVITPHFTTRLVYGSSAQNMIFAQPQVIDSHSYILFLSWHPEADGSRILAPTGEPGLAEVRGQNIVMMPSNDYESARQRNGLGPLPVDLQNVAMQSLAEAIAANNEVRAERAKLPPVGLQVSARGRALETLMYDLPGLQSSSEVMARIEELGLDPRTLNDAAFCRKVQAFVDQFGKVPVNVGCPAQ